MGAAAAALPTSLQVAAAVVGALIGLWASAIDTWGSEPAMLWLARLVGRVLSSVLLGVSGSTVLHVGGPSAWSYLHAAHPGTVLEDIGAAALGLAQLPQWLTASLLAAGSLRAMPVLWTWVRLRLGVPAAGGRDE